MEAHKKLLQHKRKAIAIFDTLCKEPSLPLIPCHIQFWINGKYCCHSAGFTDLLKGYSRVKEKKPNMNCKNQKLKLIGLKNLPHFLNGWGCNDLVHREYLHNKNLIENPDHFQIKTHIRKGTKTKEFYYSEL